MVIKELGAYMKGSGFWSTPNGLAVILTIGVLGVIVTVVIIHLYTVWQNHQTFTVMFDKLARNISTDSQSTKELFESFQNYYREANASNTNLLSILLPVIGAWVGAILAFYYGAKNMEKMTETIKATVLPTEDEKLARVKVGDILDKFPEYKNVITAKISDPVGTNYSKTTEKSTNILLLDDNGVPLGIIYKTDFTRNTARTEEQIKGDNSTFRDFFSSMATAETPIKDLIKGEVWTEKGVDNYAHINKNDSLLQARIKMKEISPRQEIKGVVLDGEKILGIITYELFSNVLTNEELQKTN
jgi:hypothetical protein